MALQSEMESARMKHEVRCILLLKKMLSFSESLVWGLSQITLACFSCFLTPSPPSLAIVRFWLTPPKNYVRFWAPPQKNT